MDHDQAVTPPPFRPGGLDAPFNGVTPTPVFRDGPTLNTQSEIFDSDALGIRAAKEIDRGTVLVVTGSGCPRRGDLVWLRISG